MTINVRQKYNLRPLKLGSELIEKVCEFDYLGIHLESRNSWSSQITKCEMSIKLRAASILRFANSKAFRPSSHVLEIWKAQAVSAACYGSELWGHSYCDSILIAENNFLRSFLNLPSSTPLVPLRYDLNLKPISNVIALIPLLFWARIWSTDDLHIYRSCLEEIISLGGRFKIP